MLLAPHLLVSVLLGQLDFGAVMDMQTLTEAPRGVALYSNGLVLGVELEA